MKIQPGIDPGVESRRRIDVAYTCIVRRALALGQNTTVVLGGDEYRLASLTTGAAGFRVEGRFVLLGEAAAIAPHAFRGSRVGALDMDSWTRVPGSVERLAPQQSRQA